MKHKKTHGYNDCESFLCSIFDLSLWYNENNKKQKER